MVSILGVDIHETPLPCAREALKAVLKLMPPKRDGHNDLIYGPPWYVHCPVAPMQRALPIGLSHIRLHILLLVTCLVHSMLHLVSLAIQVRLWLSTSQLLYLLHHLLHPHLLILLALLILPLLPAGVTSESSSTRQKSSCRPVVELKIDFLPYSEIFWTGNLHTVLAPVGL